MGFTRRGSYVFGFGFLWVFMGILWVSVSGCFDGCGLLLVDVSVMGINFGGRGLLLWVAIAVGVLMEF